MKKQFKKLVVLGMVVAMLASSTLCVSAAGLRSVFNAKYYADSYKDLKAAFGDNEEALYNHFITFGLKENRQMSPIIDVQAYRKAYPDLNAAFGDNWDAYVEHFFAYGMREGRKEGILFNPLEYAAAYPDVAAAFGTDIEAITRHYLTNGIAEGRTAGVTAKAEAAAPASGGGSSSSITSVPGTATDGSTSSGNDSGGNQGGSTTPEEGKTITVSVYNNVTCAGGKLTDLGTPVSVTATKNDDGIFAGELEETAAVVASDTNKRGDDYWYAIAVPETAWTVGSEPSMWFKYNETWVDAKSNLITGVAGVPDNSYVFGLGDNGEGGSAAIALTDGGNPDVDGVVAVKFDIFIRFKSSTGTGSGTVTEDAAEAVWAPLVDRTENSDLNGESGDLTKINKEMESGVNTTVDSADKTLAVVTFNDMTSNPIPKHKNTEEEGYWFGIGVPYQGEGYTYCWGLVADKDAAKAKVEEELSEKSATDTYGECATFYWGFLAASQDHTSKCGYLVVKQDGEVVAKYVVDFGGLRFKQEQQGGGN